MGPQSPPHSLLLPSLKMKASAPPPAPTKMCCPATGPKAMGPSTTTLSHMNIICYSNILKAGFRSVEQLFRNKVENK